MMRRRSGLAAGFVALAIIVAGCGGSQTSSPIPGGSSTSGHALKPQLNGGTGSLALPTLYVAGQGSVYAYDLPVVGANPTPDPNQAPVSSTNGYYYNAGALNASIAGISTNRAGDLVVVQNFMTPQGNGNSCQLAYVPARTGPNAANVTTTNCGNPRIPNTPGKAAGVSFTGGPVPSSTGNPAPTPGPGYVDVLMHYVPSGNPNAVGCGQPTPTPAPIPPATPAPGATQAPTPFPQYQVDRYTANGGTVQPNTCYTLDQGQTATYRAIAGITNGNFYVDYTTGGSNDAIEEYAPSFGPGPVSGGTMGGNLPGIGALAVGGTNGQYQIVASTAGGVTTIYSFFAQFFGSVTYTHALSSFTNPVTAVAVDNSGNIYVGINQPSGTKVKVYGPNKTEATQPDYILNNPVRRGNPAGAQITGIAIAQ